MVGRYVGAPVRRVEDRRLVTGNGRYTDDIGVDTGTLEAAVRSPHAHARIRDIDVTGALDVDGVVAIYSYEDLHGAAAEPLPILIPHPALHAGRTAYVLANGVVHHVGAPVAMVVAQATWPRTPSPASPSTTRSCRRWSVWMRPGPPNTPCTKTCRTMWLPT